MTNPDASNNDLNRFHILTVVGARPQFIKAAPINRAIQQSLTLRESIIHTGQHYDAGMSDVFFDELEIPKPVRRFDLGGGGHGRMTGRMLEALEDCMEELKPDAALVYGDTNSTIAGALAAAKLHIPVLHVEAGLRSFNRKMPEEINRVMADHLSKLLFCPTRTAVLNLKNEGIETGAHLVGDVMADATLFAKSKSKALSKIVSKLGIENQTFALCTIHRAENSDDVSRLDAIIDFVAEKAKQIQIVLPAHPRVIGRLKSYFKDNSAIRLIDPVGYFDMHALLAACEFVLTDSGGLQKEAYFHRKPCITLRDETEWVETIQAGWNRLWNDSSPARAISQIDDYGVGDSSGKIISIIENEFGL